MSDSDCTVQLPVPAHICMKETSFPLNEFTVGTFSNMLLFDSSKKIPVSVLSIKAIPGPMSGRHNEVTPNQTLVEHSVVWQYARVCVCATIVQQSENNVYFTDYPGFLLPLLTLLLQSPVHLTTTLCHNSYLLAISFIYYFQVTILNMYFKYLCFTSFHNSNSMDIFFFQSNHNFKLSF